MKFELTNSQSRIVRIIQLQGNQCFVVGGAVRDQLLGKKPKDLDFVTNALPEAVSTSLKIEGFTILPDTKAFAHGIVRVVDKDTSDIIDIATMREDVHCDGRHAEVKFTENPLKDLNRRDFTVNAMACLLNPDGSTRPGVEDLGYQGHLDLKDKVIRSVGSPEKRIKEDALRMIRACRFTALGEDWSIHKDSEEAIKEHANDIKKVSKERIRDEILKGLAYDKPSNFFRALATTGLLIHIFPDLAKGIGCEQNEYHSECVFDHLLRCLDVSVSLTTDPLLRLACLVHDIAKPHTKSTDDDGRVHFYKHEIEGASLVYVWMRRYKFPKKDIEYVTKLVRHHQWRFEDNSKDKTIRHWLQEVGKDTWRDLITLRCADRKGNLKKADRPMITRKMRELMDKVDTIIKSGTPIFKEDLAIDGHTLRALGIPPGKIYKEIFSNILGIVVNDPTKNTEEWLSKYVSRNYVKKKNIDSTDTQQ
jgi:poly(A) polymerase/tRNA nucleotidyltransferase (CCA-adding enzyme)